MYAVHRGNGILAVTVGLVLILAGVVGAAWVTMYCKECGNEFTELRFSASNTEMVSPAYFDDLGCAIKFRAAQCGTDQITFDGATRVFDYETGEPLKAEMAVYVLESGVQTPRGYGIVAFKDAAGAERFVASQGRGLITGYEGVKGLQL